jgi:hypothetical protein
MTEEEIEYFEEFFLGLVSTLVSRNPGLDDIELQLKGGGIIYVNINKSGYVQETVEKVKKRIAKEMGLEEG